MLLTFHLISVSALALKPALQKKKKNLYKKVLLLPLEFVFDKLTIKAP